jgi:predicted aldo/keto reductase-like oxidoreductase
MHLRRLGRTGLSVSEIGLGTEFLLGIDKQQAIRVIHAAMDAGVNYVDMFWAHPEFRDVMGSAFVGRRDRVFITAHLGSTVQQDGQYAVSRDRDVCSDFFHDDLRRTGTDHMDVVFIHNCNAQEDVDRAMGDGGLFELARAFVREGKARFVGLSGHNTVTARQVVESGVIDVLMFPVNLASYAVPGKTELLESCLANDVGLVAMKVYGGGRLLDDSSTVELEDYQIGRQQMAGGPSHFARRARITPAQCLGYVLDLPAVSTTVPGAKSVSELADALAAPTASADERDYSEILPAFAQFATGECVYCNHCLPCPSGIDVGRTLRLLHRSRDGVTQEILDAYRKLETRASDCIECGQCSSRCPFEVDVIPKMRLAASRFDGESEGGGRS